MAVVTVKSAAITNRDATPRVLNSPGDSGGRWQHAGGVVTITSGDSVGSKYLVCSIPSNAYVKSVKVSSPDIGTTTAADVGLYRTTEDAGAVVDADFFGSAVSLSGGALNKSEIVNESAVYTIANMDKPLWQAVGLSADPKVAYDLVLTLTGAADATGIAYVEVGYNV